MEAGAGLYENVRQATLADGMDFLDDMSDIHELGRQVHDITVALLKEAGHEIWTCTETPRSPVHECAKKKQKKTNEVLKSGIDDIDADLLLESDEWLSSSKRRTNPQRAKITEQSTMQSVKQFRGHIPCMPSTHDQFLTLLW